MPNAQRFTVTLEAPPWASDADGYRRLRAMLKRLARGYRLHCVDVRPVGSERPPIPAGAMAEAGEAQNQP